MGFDAFFAVSEKMPLLCLLGPNFDEGHLIRLRKTFPDQFIVYLFPYSVRTFSDKKEDFSFFFAFILDGILVCN